MLPTGAAPTTLRACVQQRTLSVEEQFDRKRILRYSTVYLSLEAMPLLRAMLHDVDKPKRTGTRDVPFWHGISVVSP